MAALTGDALDGVTHLPVTYKGYFHTVILLKREISDPWRAIDVANLLNFSNFSNFLSPQASKPRSELFSARVRVILCCTTYFHTAFLMQKHDKCDESGTIKTAITKPIYKLRDTLRNCLNLIQ
jgi:hypothetical protein